MTIDGSTGSTMNAAEPVGARSRRALLAAGLGGLMAALAAALGRPLPVRATHGDVHLGAVNNATTTTVVNNSSGADNARGLQGAITAGTPGSNSAGVIGINRGTAGFTHGVHGQHSGSGRGVFGQGASGYGVVGFSNSGHGMLGQTGATNRFGVYGYSPYRAILGASTGGGSNSAGVWGTSNATDGMGVLGNADNGFNPVGVHGTSKLGTGVRGSAEAGIGVRGESEGSAGVYGTSDFYIAVLGEGDYLDGVRGTSNSDYGVVGLTANTGDRSGVYGSGPRGVIGVGSIGVVGAGSGAASMGIFGVANGEPNYGVYGQSSSYAIWGQGAPGGYAGWFEGNAHVNGTLSKSLGTFLIDHPLDPANKTLAHSFVESPEMLNVYSGVVTADARGRATVRLPSYFAALNGDLRYQLTPLGDPAPELHVAQEVEAGRFRIAGASPGQRVSWQVSGVRQDAYAKAHPIRVEARKPARWRGRYLNPREHGQPASAGLPDVVAARTPASKPEPPKARTKPEFRDRQAPDLAVPPP